MTRFHIALCAALAVCASATPRLHAQIITSGEIERGLRFPGTIAHDGEPYTQRYSYGMPGIFYFGGNSRQLYYLDYLDKADRAEKFGYRMPVDPFFEAPQPAPTYPAVRGIFGIGFGSWRKR